MTRSDADHVRDARENLRMLYEHLDRSDLADATVFDAVCLRLAAAIESVAAIDAGLRVQAYGAEWPAIWSVRNRIAHGYIYLDRAIIRATVENRLPEFEAALDRIEEAL